MLFLRRLFWQAWARINSHFVGLVVLFTVTLAYQNCAQYSDNSLNQQNIAATAPASEPRLDIPTQQIEVAVTDDQMSFGSTCQWGASPQHYLEFKMYTTAGRQVKVQSTTTCNTTTTNADCYRNITFRCEHGKYYAVLPVTCDSYNGLGSIAYKLTGQMVTYDANNNEVRDPQAYFERQVLVDWNQAGATACGQ